MGELISFYRKSKNSREYIINYKKTVNNYMKTKFVISLGILLLVCLIVSPFIHEMVHIITFKSFSGYYFADITLLPSVYGSMRILSPINQFEYFILLAGGIGVSLFLGFMFIYFGRRKTNYVFTISGIGFLLNPSLSMFIENDISVLLSFIGMGNLSFIIGAGIISACLFEFNYFTKNLFAENLKTEVV